MRDDAKRRQRLRAFVQSQAVDELPARAHPDSHLLDDWVLYGPKDARIERLVRRLALDHGLRVADIEDFIVATLEQLSADYSDDG
ncbi:MAG: hypothetical protein ACU0CC_09760 [Sagittula sp.]|uniref:hypothetical protein n=1 Tax=Sagittula sp. TaxID=2038081 RepID=UPI0040591E50